MLTSVGHELNKKLSWKLGAEGYLTKPFKEQELLTEIDRLLATP